MRSIKQNLNPLIALVGLVLLSGLFTSAYSQAFASGA